MGSIRFPRVAAGNDIWIKVQCNLVTYYDNEIDYVGVDLNACQSIRFNLICTQHNIDIDANYEILDTSTLKAFIPKRLLHTGGVYKFQISGIDADGYEWSYVAPRTQSFIVTDESDSVAVGTILDFSAGLLTPISSIVKRDYMTKAEVLYAIDNADLSEYATNADLENYVKLSTLEAYATLEDLEDYATIGDLGYYATREQLGYYATLDDIQDIATRQWVYDQQYLTEHQSLDNYYTRTEVDDNMGVLDAKFDNYYTRAQCDERYLTYHQDISGKQDVITDLDEIRRGATLGSSSLQPSALNNYYTRTQTDAAIANAAQNVDLTNYYTKSETDAAINEAIAYVDVDLSDYVTYAYADANYLREHQSLANYVTYSYADANYLREHQSLANYYTRSEVDEAIAYVQTSGTVDLSNYVTLDNFNETSYSVAYNISYLEDKINSIDTSGTTVDLSDYVTYAYLADKYLSRYDFSEFDQSVHDRLGEKQPYITDLDTIRSGAAAGATAVQPAALNDYYTKSQVDSAIASATPDIDLTGYVTVDEYNQSSYTIAYNISYLEDKINNIDTSGSGQPVDLSNYVTYAYLADKDYSTSSDLDENYNILHQEIAAKQDTISDLSTIRTGAAAGATAVQPAALNNYYTKSQVDTEIDNQIQDVYNNIDLTGYVTVDEYNQSSYTIAYNISYLENKINNIDTSGTTVDLSDYVTYSYLSDKLTEQSNDYTLMAEGLNTQLFDLNSKLESYYMTDSDIRSQFDGMYDTLQTNLQTKQDTISDLSTIRSGAAAGATAVQPAALNNYYTKSQVDAAIAYATPNIDLSSYVTVENFNQTSFTVAYAVSYLQDQIDNIDTSGSGQPIDLSDYVTYSYADANYLREHQSLDNYYTKSQVYSKTEADNKYLTSHQSLNNYYTKSQVDTAIQNAVPDTSDYVTYAYADANYLREHQSLSNYYTKSQVYTKTEVNNLIPDTSTLAPVSYLGGLKLQTLTQSQYDALSTKDSTTLYIITD